MTTNYPPPPPQGSALLSYPTPEILLITLNRPHARNSLPFQAHWELSLLFDWVDAHPTILVAILTGAGDCFCAGQDLKEVQDHRANPPAQPYLTGRPPSGFAGFSQRRGRKPVIAAVNGAAMGGGFEICLNADMVVASPKAVFALPEAKRGLYASAGGLPRILATAGLHVASELALTGRAISAKEAKGYGLVNRISRSHESLLDEAVGLAKEVAELSPDAIITTRGGIRDAQEMYQLEEAWRRTKERYEGRMFGSKNQMEGLAAFREKRKPTWVPSVL
jgi:enoyl-CoA hydratase/carnithine racemase